MRVKITGIHGYLGNIISQKLRENGHQVSGIERQLLYGNSMLLRENIAGCDILINLAGAPILQYWTRKNKAKIYNSRVKTTRQLVQAINALPSSKRPRKYIQASAIGIYQPNEYHNEDSTNYANSFLGSVVKDWETALDGLPQDMDKTLFRLGLVLGKDAQIIKRLSPIFRLGLGGKIGSGLQAFPFVHEKDLCRAFLAATEDSLASGVYNLVAPQNINNRAFTIALAKQLKRPVFFIVPSIMLKLFLGNAAQILLESPQASAEKICFFGFQFKYPTIEQTLEDIIPTRGTTVV